MCKTAPARSATRGDDVTQAVDSPTPDDNDESRLTDRRTKRSPRRLESRSSPARGDSRGEASLGTGEARWIFPPKHVGRRSPERRPRDDGRRRNLP